MRSPRFYIQSRYRTSNHGMRACTRSDPRTVINFLAIHQNKEIIYFWHWKWSSGETLKIHLFYYVLGGKRLTFVTQGGGIKLFLIRSSEGWLVMHFFKNSESNDNIRKSMQLFVYKDTAGFRNTESKIIFYAVKIGFYRNHWWPGKRSFSH